MRIVVIFVFCCRIVVIYVIYGIFIEEYICLQEFLLENYFNEVCFVWDQDKIVFIYMLYYLISINEVDVVG